MAVYYINLALILGLGFLLCVYKPSKIKKILYLVITFGYMWFLATFREGIGFDYYNYIEIFKDIQQANSLEALLGQGFEWGFVFLTKLMSLFISNETVMYGVYSFLILVPIAWFIYANCKDVWLSTWLYVTLAFFYTNMNFIRQSLACGIIALGYGFLKEKKTIPFIIIVIFAASFHKTALIMIPVYFLCHFKFNKKWAIFYASATVLLFLTSSLILDFVTRFIFSYYRGTIYLTQGFPMVFLLVPFTIFGVCIAMKTTWDKRDPDAGVLFYLTMFSAIIWLFITRHFILERFSMYIYIFSLVALPSALSCLRSPQEDVERLGRLQEESKKGKGGKSKEMMAQIRELSTSISDHNKFYWSAVAGILFITMLYNEFGGHVNGFHNVFPYQSVLPWL